MKTWLKIPLAYWILTFKVNKPKSKINSMWCRRLICRSWSVAVGCRAPPWWNMSDRRPGSWLMPSSVSVEMMEASPSAPWRTTDLSLRAPEDTHHPDYISATDTVWAKQNESPGSLRPSPPCRSRFVLLTLSRLMLHITTQTPDKNNCAKNTRMTRLVRTRQQPSSGSWQDGSEPLNPQL